MKYTKIISLLMALLVCLPLLAGCFGENDDSDKIDKLEDELEELREELDEKENDKDKDDADDTKAPGATENTVKEEDIGGDETEKPQGTPSGDKNKVDIDNIKDVVVVDMIVKDFGKMTFELYHDVAPLTVENFVTLAADGFYDGTVFHRIVKDFVIQGGDDNGDGIGGSEKTIKGEFLANGFVNTLKHERGVISMARTSDPNSASSQFFIMHQANEGLDGNYAAFGKLTEGFDVLDEIASVKTTYNVGGEKSAPVNDVVLERIVIKETFDRDGEDAAERPAPPTVEELCENTIEIEMSVAGHGVITLELYPDLAPITVENFVSLAGEGFYDGLTFHRIIEDFMIQGGDPEGTGMGGSDETIKGEFASNGVYNPLPHERGVISMARSQMPDSASSQFFICHADSPHLDGQYAAFGRVIDGIEVVDSIASVETDYNDYPIETVVIEYVKVIEK